MDIPAFLETVVGQPYASFRSEVEVVDLNDGKGPFINHWAVAGVTQPTDAALRAALAAPDPAPTTAGLVAYASAKQLALRDAGVTVNVGTSGAQQIVDVASDVNGRSLVSGCVQLIGLASQNGQPAPTFPWINDDGSSTTLAASQILTIGYKLGAYVQATYATLGVVLAAIGNGTLTTFAGIDSADWPARAV